MNALWCCLTVVLLGLVGVLAYEYLGLRRLADRRLELVRRLIDHSYQYAHQPLTFVHKFNEEVCVQRLLEAKIVPMPRHAATRSAKESEVFLCRLIDAGFSRREVCVIFGLKNIGSLYVKYHRIKKKLRAL